MSGAAAWAGAGLAAALLAVDPVGLGGACLRARAGPVREAWLGLLARLVPGRATLRLPPGVADARLLGGIDLAATLAAGRPVQGRGLLEAAQARLLVLPMAERAAPGLVARLNAATDARAGFLLVALDEGAEPDEAAPGALTDRLAFWVQLDGVAMQHLACAEIDAAEIDAARARLAQVRAPMDLAESLVGVAAALGIASLRAPMLALRAARAAAALTGGEVDTAAAATAVRLVLAPRATRLPETAAEADQTPPAEAQPETDHEPQAEREDDGPGRIPQEVLLEAARAALPADLLARLLAGRAFRGPGARTAGSGGERTSRARGRPAGAMRGSPRDGARLDLIETLRAAAPWQPLRRGPDAEPGRVLVRLEDFRIRRSKRRAEKVVIFVVDASGSTALARLAEAKGAIELMLAQAYVARQQVALVAFRGAGAEVLLPPTRSLAMTKRRLAGLPGGGGTPLAAGLAAALALAAQARGRGIAPYVALLTDGRANIALDGAPGRGPAQADAERLARVCRAAELPAMVIDTGNRPSPAARVLAEQLGAGYLALPRADAGALAGAMRAALAGAA